MLDALVLSGMQFAILHGEQRLANSDPISDVDLVVGQAPRDFLRQSVDAIRSVGLHPVCVNDYDAGGSATAQLATVDGAEGVQLDLYFDPHARGRLGISTTGLLRNAVSGRRWPAVAPTYELVYLIRKRQWKGDIEGLDDLVRRSASVDGHGAEAAIEDLAIPVAARSVRRILAGKIDEPFHSSTRHAFANQLRRLGKVRAPVGFWVELIGSEAQRQANQLAIRFGRYFRMARAAPRPAGLVEAGFWSLRAVAPVRMRTGIFVSYSTSEILWPKADLVLSDVSEETAHTAREVVAAMEQRLGLG